MSMVQITVSQGRELFVALGRRTAVRWGAANITNAINDALDELATEEAVAALEGDAATTYNSIIDATEGLEVVEDAPAAKPKAAAKGKGKAKAKAAAPKAKAAAPKAAAPKAAAPKAAAPKAAAPKAAAPKAKAATPKAAAPKAADGDVKGTSKTVTRGVRMTSKTRPWHVGEVLAANCTADEDGGLILPDEITPEMIDAVDEAYADGTKVNARETAFAMRNALHALRGFYGIGPEEKAEAVAEEAAE